MRVIVVGAGLAGLAAARDLKAKDHDVVVIEARNRTGGRIWTDHSLGTAIDLGASWIHGDLDNPLFAIAEANEIETAKTNYQNTCIFNEAGQLFDRRATQSYLDRINQLILDLHDLSESLDDDITVKQAIETLLARNNLSYDENCFFNRYINDIEALHGVEISRQSLWGLTRYEHGFDGDDFVFPQGYGQIIESLADGLSIRLNEPVLSIKYDDEGVQVITALTTHNADFAVITIPLGVLARDLVEFSPPLPEDKQLAIKTLKMGALDKVAMRFKEVFWPKSVDLIETAPDARDSICFFLNWYKYSKEPILIGFAGGSASDSLIKKSREQIKDEIMTSLRKMFQTATDPEEMIYTSWRDEEFAFGSYSIVPMGAGPEHFDALGKPCKRLHFAGEATSLVFQGTAHGALISGIRAANEIEEIARAKAEDQVLDQV